MDNWDNLRIYLAVARAGTVSAAARALGLGHATVLRRIDQFEKDLGTKLFKRLQSGYQLSTEGKALLEHAERIEESTHAIQRQLEGNSEQIAGTLRVTQPENDVLDLYPIYAEFIQRYPQISLEIISSASLANLNKQEADVALRFTDAPDELLVGRCLGTIHFGAYASQGYLDQIEGPPSMANCRWILWQGKDHTQSPARSSQYEWVKRRVSNPEIILRTSSVSDIISGIRAGIGVGFISHPVARQYPELIPLPGAEFTSSLKLWILTHRDLKNLARVRCFMQFVAEKMLSRLSS
jgi:DNA-binding transcriptional LysR family regulator